MKIYTKTGDQGETALFGGERVKKNHPRVKAYGSLDEANSMIGLALSFLPPKESLIKDRLTRVQNELFQLGSELASPKPATYLKYVGDAEIVTLEKEIDSMDETLSPLKNFILPGGSSAGASLHVARTLIRKSERLVVEMNDPGIRPEVVQYLNRLSDYLFVSARYVNAVLGEIETTWSAK